LPTVSLEPRLRVSETMLFGIWACLDSLSLTVPTYLQRYPIVYSSYDGRV